MDLKRFTAVDILEVTIQHSAFEEGQEPIFVMAGPCHIATKKADKARMETITKARGKHFDHDKLATAHTSARVLGWKNVAWEGKSLDWSPENALMVLATPALQFIKDQLHSALGDDESFFMA